MTGDPKATTAVQEARPYLPLSASASTGAGPPAADSVKNVPTLRPAMIVLMALSWVPLQMTTLTPRSSAQVAAFTFESMPPVPTLDFWPNSMVLRSCEVYVCIMRAPSSHGGLL